MFEYHLIVIGAGTAGLTAARLTARNGKKVALIERDSPGGDCLWTGCVPTKSLIHVAHLMHGAQASARFGVVSENVRLDFDAVRRHVAGAQAAAGAIESPEAIAGYGVHLVRGEARFVDEHTVAVGGDRLTGNYFVIATGSSPVAPPIPGLQDAGFDTNVEAVAWTSVPTSLCVIGGGPIGVEFAQTMNRLGASTTLLEVGPRILERDDPKAAEVITRVMTNEGVLVRTGVRILSVERTATGKRVHFEHGGTEESVDAERLLVATGRRPRLESLDLASAGVDHSAKGVVVDDQLRTSRRHIFAIGDAAGGYQFTHVAEAQGRLTANIIAGKRFQKWSDRVVPRVTYTAPEVASVGLREDEARKAGKRDVRTWEVPLSSVDRAITMGETEGFFKVVTARGWNRMAPGLRKLMGDEIVGACLVAPNAGDLLMPIVMAMRAHLPMGIVAWNMQAYPTLALGVRQVTGLPFD